MRKKPPSKRFLQIPDFVYETPAFRTLPSAAMKLWIDLRTQYRGGNNGNITAALSVLCHRGWASSQTLSRATWILLDRGLLRRTREGKSGPLQLCALYAFTDLPTNANERLELAGAPPSNEFARWVRGVSFAPSSKAQRIPKKKTAVTETESKLIPKRNSYRDENGTVEPAAVTEMESVLAAQNSPNPAPALASGATVH